MRLQTMMPPDRRQINDLFDPGDEALRGEIQDEQRACGLFYRDPGAGAVPDGGGLLLSGGCELSFDTCFGSFLTQKWLRYTALSTLWTEAVISGSGTLTLMRAFPAKDGTLTREAAASAEYDTDGGYVRVRLEAPSVLPESMYYLTVSAREQTRIDDAYFGCDNDDDADEVSIAAAICTYKREQYVENTLAVFDDGILSNRNSPLRGHFCVYISDNARTLDKARLENDSVHIFPNKNCGGTGGFTRCMLEIMEREPERTHILLADDDAVIPVRSIEIIYSFLRLLKPEHKDITAGGALWRSDLPWKQYEAGAGWDGCHVLPRGADLDMRAAGQLVENSLTSELIDFNGWWLCCVPVARIRDVGLPLPLFLHRDDIEYGMRLRGRIVIPDGAGVWHETFERRMSGVSEYYDLRNMLIVNAIHRPQFSAGEYLAFVKKWYLRNLYSHRYRYVRMNLGAVRDALGGVDAFAAVEPERHGAEVRAACYKLSDADGLAKTEGIVDFTLRRSGQIGERFYPELCNKSAISAKKRLYPLLNALTVIMGGGLWLPAKRRTTLAVHPTPVWQFFRSGSILHTDAENGGFVTRRDRTELRRCRELWCETARAVYERYDRACEEYRARYKELTTEGFWRGYLK